MSDDADLDFIAAAMPAFISEAAEQIEAIETLLLELEEQPDNRELLDSPVSLRAYGEGLGRHIRSQSGGRIHPPR